MIFFIIGIVVYLGLNGLVFRSLLHTMAHWPLLIKISISVLFWVLSVSFVLFQISHSRLQLHVAHYLYWLSTGWLAFFLYLALSLVVTTLLKWMGIPIPCTWGISLALTLLVLTLGHIHFRNPVIKYQKIALTEQADPANRMRVVAISDVHLGYGINKSMLKKYISLINEQKPDLILIGGDLIDMSVRPLWEEKMQEELNKLSAPLGVYTVLGNHEYISGREAATQFIRSTNITLLRDSVIKLPNGVQIVGRDDRSNPTRQSITDLLAQTDTATPVFVLDHQPANDEVEQMVNTGRASFSFFGHTHKGQIWPLNYVTALVYKQDYGYQLRNTTHLYVSSGLGLWGPPFRIGTDSEIVVIDFSF